MQPLLRTDKAHSLLYRKMSRGRLSEFEESLLLKEIALLSKTDHWQAESIRAMSLTAEGHFDEAITIHEKVLAAEPKESAFVGNYASSLSLAGRYQDSYNMLMRACQLDESNPIFLEGAIQSAWCLQRPDLAKLHEEQFKKLTGKDFPGTGKNLLIFSEVASDYCYSLPHLSGSFSDWERSEEEEAWQHLQ